MEEHSVVQFFPSQVLFGTFGYSLATCGECPSMIKTLKFLKIYLVKSQVLGMPMINLVYTELHISAAWQDSFIKCMRSEQRVRASDPTVRANICRLCLCSPATGLLHQAGRIEFRKHC